MIKSTQYLAIFRAQFYNEEIFIINCHAQSNGQNLRQWRYSTNFNSLGPIYASGSRPQWLCSGQLGGRVDGEIFQK